MPNVRLNRQQLAQFLPNAEVIKAFEQLFSNVQDSIPTSLDDVQASADSAIIKAAQALEELATIANVLSLALYGVYTEPVSSDYYNVINEVQKDDLYIPPIVLDKSSIGLGNVDNTSDTNKPVSTAQATAIALKADSAQPAWVAATFANSWVNFGAPYNNAEYFKDSFGIVHLRGLIKSGTMQQAAFTLPVGFRPANTNFISTIANNAFASVLIASDGTVKPWDGSNVWFSLDNISFKT